MKIAIVSKTVVPDLALIDPAMTVNMNPELTACTGVDALTHAIEAYVSNASSPVTDIHAIEAIRLIRSSLADAYSRPDDLEMRARMMLGSLYAGLAFSNASLGAVHAMSHSLGGQLNLPHGLCNALLLRHVASFNFAAAPVRYQNILSAMGSDTTGKSSVELNAMLSDDLQALLRSVGLDRSLGSVGVSEGDIPLLAAKAIADPCMVTNPCRLSLEDIKVIFRDAL